MCKTKGKAGTYKLMIRYDDGVTEEYSDEDNTLIWEMGTLFIKGIDFAPQDVQTTFTGVTYVG